MSWQFLGQLWRSAWLGVVGAALAPALLLAAGRNHNLPANAADAEQIDLFDGIQKGDLAVKFQPKDAKEAKIVIQNKSKRPLNVKLPETFAGVPVLAQAGAGGANPAGARGQGVGGAAQGGIGYIPPEHIEQFKVQTVCLEHGKPEPRPSMAYEIKPLDSFTDKPGVADVCRMLGTGRISQRVAQAAAWHLNNGMSWQQLAAERNRFANGTSSPFFTPQELRAAMQMAATAQQLDQQRRQASSSEAK